MFFIPHIAEPSRRLNESALPDAPVVDDERANRAISLRLSAAAALRRTAEREVRIANRLDPACQTA
ncbi:MAG: hypothetical protein ACTH2Q_14495 [Propionibacteriaceae bacterium]